MKRKLIHIHQNLYDNLIDLSERKSISKTDALEYAVRLAISISDYEEQQKKDIENIVAKLRGLTTETRREIAYQIRNQSRLNRALAIMVEMLREDIEELRNKNNC